MVNSVPPRPAGQFNKSKAGGARRRSTMKNTTRKTATCALIAERIAQLQPALRAEA